MGISMDDLLWGLMMMAVGMGVVFALLLVLMAVLMLIGRLDRPATERPAVERPAAERPAEADIAATGAGAGRGGGGDDSGTPAARAVRIIADGLDENQVAAITVAVITHAENRRRIAAAETRAHAPGSQLFASRWLAVGRGFQNNPFTRR